MTKKIAFYSNQLGERGTEIALYDYAYYNETLLNNKSIIIYNKNHHWNNENAIKKFKNKFEVFGISSDTNAAEIDNILLLEKCNIIYMILYGTPIQVPTQAKVCIHCVFFCMDKPFGHVYSSIAPWVKNNNNRYPVVPHMINLPDNNDDMREELGIPDHAVVYGWYGGVDEFNIEYVHKTIYRVAKTNPNIFFLFANTNKFCDNLANIIHIDAIIDLNEKVKFINTCDAMIWARRDGETFGLAIAEFSIKNKPILCTRVGGNLAHVALLKENAFWYDENNLEEILTSFDKEENAKKDWNMYRDYMPEPVMQTFKQVYIDSVPDNLHPINFSIPECKISPTIPLKMKLLSSIIPGDRTTYNFKTETEYYNEYRSSMFAKTCKKSGWDCMRHYEIIANGCIPYFTDLDLCPKDTMTLLPKDLLKQGNALYESMVVSYTDNDLYKYIELNKKLMINLKMNLTTRKMANYILEKSKKLNVSNILFLSGSTFPDYLRCLTLHGFKELFGARCHDYPKVAHMYKNQDIDYTSLYGMGMTYSNILEPEMNNNKLDKTIEEDIKARKYDLVIYGSYHRGLPYYDLVSKIYRGDEIIMLCGEDIHECKAKDYILSRGHHLFVREL